MLARRRCALRSFQKSPRPDWCPQRHLGSPQKSTAIQHHAAPRPLCSTLRHRTRTPHKGRTRAPHKATRTRSPHKAPHKEPRTSPHKAHTRNCFRWFLRSPKSTKIIWSCPETSFGRISWRGQHGRSNGVLLQIQLSGMHRIIQCFPAETKDFKRPCWNPASQPNTKRYSRNPLWDVSATINLSLK